MNARSQTSAFLAVLLASVAMSAVPMGAAVPYLQHEVDAGRTGASTDPGPTHLDVAFTIELPDARAAWSPPMILDGGSTCWWRLQQV